MTQRFKLVCTACEFERPISGLDPALDAGEAHREHGGEDHSVDIYSFSYLATHSEIERQQGETPSDTNSDSTGVASPVAPTDTDTDRAVGTDGRL